MKTRQDYLDKKCSHREYYTQFVTPGVKYVVSRYIGLEAIRNSTDKHFNDIPLKKWDNLFQPFPGDVARMMREAGDYPTLAGVVSLAKEAARQLLEESLVS